MQILFDVVHVNVPKIIFKQKSYRLSGKGAMVTRITNTFFNYQNGAQLTTNRPHIAFVSYMVIHACRNFDLTKKKRSRHFLFQWMVETQDFYSIQTFPRKASPSSFRGLFVDFRFEFLSLSMMLKRRCGRKRGALFTYPLRPALVTACGKQRSLAQFSPPQIPIHCSLMC